MYNDRTNGVTGLVKHLDSMGRVCPRQLGQVDLILSAVVTFFLRGGTIRVNALELFARRALRTL